MLIFASDLDNTLIFSKRRISGESVVIEDFREPSEMLIDVWDKLKKINKEILFVPITTRNISQYTRIDVLGEKPKLAFCSNGGNMLINGIISDEYAEIYKKSIKNAINQMENCIEFLRLDGHNMRTADDLFYYTKTEDENLVEYIRKNNETDLLDIDFSAEKLYIFPKNLNKSIAIDKIREMYPDSFIISAGDSNLDIPMLLKSDIALTLEKNQVSNGIVCKNGDFSQFVVDYVLKYI